MWPDATWMYLFMSTYALTSTRSNKDTCCHSLHTDSRILLVLLPADCRCSLQAAFTFLFHHLSAQEVTPGLMTSWLLASWQALYWQQAANAPS